MRRTRSSPKKKVRFALPDEDAANDVSGSPQNQMEIPSSDFTAPPPDSLSFDFPSPPSIDFPTPPPEPYDNPFFDFPAAPPSRTGPVADLDPLVIVFDKAQIHVVLSTADPRDAVHRQRLAESNAGGDSNGLAHPPFLQVSFRDFIDSDVGIFRGENHLLLDGDGNRLVTADGAVHGSIDEIAIALIQQFANAQGVFGNVDECAQWTGAVLQRLGSDADDLSQFGTLRQVLAKRILNLLSEHEGEKAWWRLL